MPAAGDPVYASDVLRARPRMISDSATSTLPASQTAVDVPGILIAFTTETANADLTMWWNFDADPLAAATATLMSARPRITGPSGFLFDPPVFATYSSAATADRGTPGNTWKTELGAAGAYTVVLKGTTGANQQINIYSSLTVMIQEQFT